MYANFQTKRKTFTFWAQICPKMDFGGLDSKSAPPTYLVSRFSVKMDNFEFFGLNLGKLPNYVRYFGSNNVEGVAESWVEAEMSWVEVDGTGWSWVEVDGAWWSWVHGLVMRSFKTPWGKLPNLLGVKLTTDVILLFLSSVNNGIFVYFWSCRFVLWN